MGKLYGKFLGATIRFKGLPRPSSGSLLLTPGDPLVVANNVLSASSATLNLVSIDPDINEIFIPTPASLTLTPQNVETDLSVPANTATLTLTPQEAVAFEGDVIDATAASLTLTPQETVVQSAITPTAGSLTLTPQETVVADAFTPSSVTGLQVWLDAQDSGTITTGLTTGNGDRVTTWADKSGNGYDFTNSADDTTNPEFHPGNNTTTTGNGFDGEINGLPCIEFNNDFLAINNSTLGDLFEGAQVATMFFVLREELNSETVFGMTEGATLRFLLEQHRYWRESVEEALTETDGYGWVEPTGATTDPSARLICVRMDDANNFFAYNYDGDWLKLNDSIVEVVVGNITDMALGDRSATDADPWRGVIGEFALYNTAVSDSDVFSLIEYFRDRWALTDTVRLQTTLQTPGSTPPGNVTSGLFGWWDAQDNGTITVDGNNQIIQWDDKTGNGNHMDVGAGTPTLIDGFDSTSINNNDSIRCVADVLRTKIGNSVSFHYAGEDNPYTVFLVWRENSGSTSIGDTWISFGNTLLTNPLAMLYHDGVSDDRISFFKRDDGGTSAEHNPTAGTFQITNGSVNVASLVDTGTSVTYNLNGSEVTSGFSANVGLSTLQSISIGGRPEPGATVPDMSVGECLVYNRALTAQEISDIEAALNEKWNIDVLFPAQGQLTLTGQPAIVDVGVPTPESDPDTVLLVDMTSDGNHLVDISGTLTTLELNGVQAAYDTGDIPSTLTGDGSERFDDNWHVEDLTPSAEWDFGSNSADTAVTYEAWIKFDSVSGEEWFLGRNDNGIRNLIIAKVNDELRFYIALSSGSFSQFDTTVYNLAADTWTLITIQWTGGNVGTIDFWKDGVWIEQLTATHETAWYRDVGKVSFGAVESNSINRMLGNIAQLRVMKRLLYTSGEDFAPHDLLQFAPELQPQNDPDAIMLMDFTTDGNHLNDLTGTLNNLSVNGTQAAYDTGDAPAALSGGSERFDGNWDIVELEGTLPADWDFGSGANDSALTADAWFKVDSTAASEQIISRNGNSQRNCNWVTSGDGLRHSVATSTAGFTTFDSNASVLSNDTWAHGTWQWQGGNLSEAHFWVDGVYQGTSSIAHDPDPFFDVGEVRVGAVQSNSLTRLTGNIAQTRVVKRQLYIPNVNFESGDLTQPTSIPKRLPDSNVLLETIVPDNTSGSADFTATDSTIYTHYRIVGWLKPATDDILVRMRASTDGGSTFLSGASDYEHHVVSGVDSGSRHSGGDADTSTFWTIAAPNFDTSTGVSGANATDKLWIDVMIIDPHSTSSRSALIGTTSFIGASNDNLAHFTFGGTRNATADDNAFNIEVNFGNIESGELKMYGYK